MPDAKTQSRNKNFLPVSFLYLNVQEKLSVSDSVDDRISVYQFMRKIGGIKEWN